MIEVEVLAASNAADRGLRALADLAAAAYGSNYRVIGGHMVHLLNRIYPTTDSVARVTADADAGMDTVAAADSALHDALVERGYRLVTGNHYEAPSGSATPLSVDLLVPSTSGRPLAKIEYDGRGFHAIPGLNLVLATDALDVRVRARLTTSETLLFEVPVPDVEQAVVLKALAWRSRLAPKDVTDLCALLVIAHEYRDRLPEWKLDTPHKGARGDAAKALFALVSMIDRRRPVDGLTIAPGRLAALIRTHVADPDVNPNRPGSRNEAGVEVAPDRSGRDALLSALAAAAAAHAQQPRSARTSEPRMGGHSSSGLESAPDPACRVNPEPGA
ncbi:hypothetical protein HF877_05375 [Rhodococcus sp. BL-253-APC-6A1W]|uniref:hypothetical protein n=1 Tax=Rhodococcus sp. BL-253-APC-6A1W TaxID=2725307 RepID=UPI00146F0E36|nr:hypothetical protein [Rhodococcus sp. BL-253-APC-6A1W]NMD94834.1 hypothetical protein [Rhodococcus sp. BL-253-APC-6A1W]